MSRNFEEFVRLASIGTILVTALLASYLIILAFARDKIVRPRLFSWGAILFALSIVVPVLGQTIVSLIGAYSQRGGSGNLFSPTSAGSLGGMSELLVTIISLGAMISAPLFLAISILFAIIGMLPKFENRREHYSPHPQNAPPQYAPPQYAPVQQVPAQQSPPQYAPSQKAPHPLD